MPEKNALGDKLGIVALELTAEHAVFTMPVEGNTQVAGVLHGGATAALCENAASRAANVYAREKGAVAMGTELSISHVRPGLSGLVTATATAEHLGRTRTVHRVTVKDERGRLVSTALVTNMIVVR